jgi:type II secretory pathway pseudopilin PulG
MKTRNVSWSGVATRAGFSFPDLLVMIAAISLLLAIIAPITSSLRQKQNLAQCISNLRQINRVCLMYADENQKTLPLSNRSGLKDTWWFYKENVKEYAGLKGKSSPQDKLFACPNDRGYEEDESAKPFSQSAKFDFNSYPFNGVNLPGLPNIAGREVSTIREPHKTLLVMEWTAHAPLSWHRSKTGKRNTPFYKNAESAVGFVDNHVSLTPIYYDGINAAYTRDPIPGYNYKYSAD